MTFSQRLKHERELRGWSQAKLAEELGTTPVSVSKWERGLALPSSHFRGQLYALFATDAQKMDLLLDTNPEHEEPAEQEGLVPQTQQVQKTQTLSRSSNRYRLLSKVRAFWIKGVLEQSLNGVAPIALNFRKQPEAVENPWQSVLQHSKVTLHPLSLNDSITQVYDDANGELLILGEPGAGKTTLLLELARDLLVRAEGDETHPIPVIFNLSSWVQKRQPLAQWLAEELNSKYQVPRKLGQAWIDTDQVLPLLDGLDEVTAPYRTACIEAINVYRQKHGLLPMVVCSRKADYLAQTARLVLHDAVVVQPLTEQQIDGYLSGSAKHLTGMQLTLHHDPTLQELAITPLMLNIFALAYRGIPSQDLQSANSLEERRRRVFASYVQQMLERRGKGTSYTSQQTIHWLSWLARQLNQHGQTEFHLERIQASWLSVARWRQLYSTLTTKVVFGLITWLIVAFTMGTILGPFPIVLSGQSALSILMTFGVFLGSGLPCGVLCGVLFAVMSKPKQVESARGPGIWARLWQGLLAFFVFGLVGGFGELYTHITATPTLRLETVLLGGLINGCVGCLVVLSSLVKGLDEEIQPAEVMMWSWVKMRQSFGKKLRKGLFIPLGIGFFCGLFVGIPLGVTVAQAPAVQASDPGSKLLVVLICGLGGGLIGLALGFIPAVAVGLIAGLAGGLSRDMLPEEDLVRPNQGLWYSARHSVLIGLVSGMITLLVYGLTTTFLARLSFLLLPSVAHFQGQIRDPFALFINDMALGLLPGLAVGLVLGLRNGGAACIQHGILRFLLWRTKCLPWNYPRFLDYAAERILLRKVGGGYIFTHRLLLEYFASLPESPQMPSENALAVDADDATNYSHYSTPTT